MLTVLYYEWKKDSSFKGKIYGKKGGDQKVIFTNFTFVTVKTQGIWKKEEYIQKLHGGI